MRKLLEILRAARPFIMWALDALDNLADVLERHLPPREEITPDSEPGELPGSENPTPKQ